MIDVVIPTLMMSDRDIFDYSLEEANASPSVSNIFVIDNTDSQSFRSSLDKVRILGVGHNVFVNPAWNLGVNASSASNVLIMNDDIACCRNNFDIVDEVLITDATCGLCSIQTENIASLTDYKQSISRLSRADKITTNETFGNPDRNKTGWFFAFKRKLWKNIPIAIKIIHGDDLIFMRIRKLGFSTKNITSTHIGHIGSKTVNKILGTILPQVNIDISNFNALHNLYLEDK